VRATKECGKGGMEKVFSQIVTHELGMPRSKRPKKNDHTPTGTSPR
jgi:hypothetical protein